MKDEEQKDYPFFDQLHDIDDLPLKQIVRIPVVFGLAVIVLGTLWGLCAVVGWALWHLPHWVSKLIGA